MNPKISAVIVSHNSQNTLDHCLSCLVDQKCAIHSLILVDSGSDDCSYLDRLEQKYPLTIIRSENVGFSRANNIAYDTLSQDTDFVLFVNPDLFVSPEFISQALQLCEAHPRIGMVSGKLLAYEIEHKTSSGIIDSTGILRKWYGRWYDRGQGESDMEQYGKQEIMPALCGALLFCRNKALQSLLAPVFDADFFLYKEDIELSLRMRKSGWELWYHPELAGYHCRGWANDRAQMSLQLRKQAAKSELLLYKKHPSPYVLWAFLKYILVSVFHL